MNYTIEQLEEAILDAASSFGRGASPALERWIRKNAELIAAIRLRRGKPVGVMPRLIQEEKSK